MLKIIIDGEGSRGKVEVDNFKDANFEVMMRCSRDESYNKTWITILKDDKEINKTRLNLRNNDICKSFKTLLLEDIERDINYCNRRLQDLENKNYNTDADKEKMIEYIKECENVKMILQAMDNKGNLKSLYDYSFMFKGEKVWGYTLDELQEDKYTETTLKILSGEVKGYQEPIPNCKKEDIKVIIKELQIAI